MAAGGIVVNTTPLNVINYAETLFSPRWFIENMLWIVDKNNQLVKFKLNREQSIMLEHIEFCLANDLPIRIIVLKARQIGSTTFFTALGFWMAAMNRNVTYGIVAHRFDSAESIFQKCKVFYNNLPREIQPATIQLSGDGITFDKKNGKGINSKIKFATVSEGVFRGQTLSYLHLSECAFWEGDVQAVENSLAPTVSLNPRTIIVRESTANGYNFFKDRWDRASKKKSEETPFFFGWQDHEEYRMPVPKDFVLDETEAELKKRFNLTNEQLQWRRYQINNNYNGNVIWFQQENPMTPEEAFVASGGGVFDAETIVKGYAGSIPPKDKITLKCYPSFEKLLIWEHPQNEKQIVYAQRVVWSDEQQKYVYENTDLVTEELNLKTPYTIAVDTSGLGADYNQVVVINNITKKVAARYGKKAISEEMLAHIAVEIATYYNEGMIAAEVNFSHEIYNYIIKLGYKNLYITESLSRQDRKVIGGIEYGWNTSNTSKGAMISNMRSLVNADPSIIQDREIWEEMEYFLMMDIAKGIMGAASGHHDDMVMATAIGLYVSSSFQAKQSRLVVRDLVDTSKLTDIMVVKPKNKKTPIRKGLYRNHA